MANLFTIIFRMIWVRVCYTALIYKKPRYTNLHVSDCEICLLHLSQIGDIEVFSGSYNGCKLWPNHYKHWCQSLYSLQLSSFVTPFFIFNLLLIFLWFIKNINSICHKKCVHILKTNLIIDKDLNKLLNISLKIKSTKLLRS